MAPICFRIPLQKDLTLPWALSAGIVGEALCGGMHQRDARVLVVFVVDVLLDAVVVVVVCVFSVVVV